MNIKLSAADCSTCDLLMNKSLIAKTNCEKDLSKVDILFISEYFDKNDFKNDEIMHSSNNQIFYEMFRKYKLDKEKYLFSSLVLCELNEFKEDEREEKILQISDNCKKNVIELIKICNPKIIVGMGINIVKAFNFVKNYSGITSVRGKVYEWKKYKFFMIMDSQFIKNNQNYMNIYDSDFNKLSELVTGKKKEIQISSSIRRIGSGIQLYKIPKKFYTDEYRLVDIHYIYKTSEILYIFRDKDNNKIYHRHNDDYYFYMCKDGIDNKKIVKSENVDAYIVNWKNKKEINPDISYEGDVRLPIKHSIDYYIQNKEECHSSKLNNFFCDIEIDMEGDNAFPSPDVAAHPINMISAYYHDTMYLYVLDNGKVGKIDTDIDGVDIRVFKNEKRMMQDFITLLKECDPDSISGWNFKNFDMAYIYNRLPKINIKPESFSKFGIFSVDARYNRVDLPGIHCHCQLELYKEYSFGTKSSYKLDSIAELEIGANKVQLPHSIGDMYYKDINGLIKYSIQDTMLLVKLEDKLGHIALSNEIKSVCSSTLSGVISTFGQVDPLIISYMKKKNCVVKSANYHIKKQKLTGAFVKQPTPGIYEMFTDFDFTSLYPSIICTYNIGVETFVMHFVDPFLGYDMIYDRDNLPDKIEIINDPMYKNELIIMDKQELIDRFEKEKLICTINGCFYKNHKTQISELGEIIEYLMSSRKTYKNKMFEAKVSGDKLLTNFYNTKQLVYKVIANSLYGVTANNVFRFFNISSAGAITASGQEAIKNSIIYADAKMRSMEKQIEYVSPQKLTKKEIFDDVMPNRPTPYIITSDTDSIFCCFEDFEDCYNLQNIRDWCGEIQNMLNNDIMIHMTGLHNVDKEFNVLNLKNELICAKGLFLSKKHYVIRVIEQEGKAVNDVLHTGIETKRSDFPVKTKEFLNNLINLMIGDKKPTLKELLEFVKMQEMEFDELLQKGDISLAKSISFGKKLSEYKKIPQNVVAMLNWNDLVYNHFNYGDRGYLFKIKGIKEDIAPKSIIENYHKNFLKKGRKLQVIALPEEENKIPDYFILDIQSNKKFVFIFSYFINNK